MHVQVLLAPHVLNAGHMKLPQFTVKLPAPQMGQSLRCGAQTRFVASAQQPLTHCELFWHESAQIPPEPKFVQ